MLIIKHAKICITFLLVLASTQTHTLQRRYSKTGNRNIWTIFVNQYLFCRKTLLHYLLSTKFLVQKFHFEGLSRIPPQCKFTYAKDENSVLFSVSKMCVVCTVHTYIFFFVIEFMRKWQVAVVLLKLEISTEYRWKFPAPKLDIFEIQIKVKVFLVALFSASNLINFWLKIGMKQFKYLNRKSDRFYLENRAHYYLTIENKWTD